MNGHVLIIKEKKKPKPIPEVEKTYNKLLSDIEKIYTNKSLLHDILMVFLTRNVPKGTFKFDINYKSLKTESFLSHWKIIEKIKGLETFSVNKKYRIFFEKDIMINAIIKKLLQIANFEKVISECEWYLESLGKRVYNETDIFAVKEKYLFFATYRLKTVFQPRISVLVTKSLLILKKIIWEAAF